jgi:hypothetical protein
MKLKLALAGLLVVAYVLPAAAQTTYYIVENQSTHHCQIVSQKPETQDVTIVGEDGYPTEVAAQTAMKTVKVCNSD